MKRNTRLKGTRRGRGHRVDTGGHRYTGTIGQRKRRKNRDLTVGAGKARLPHARRSFVVVSAALGCVVGYLVLDWTIASYQSVVRSSADAGFWLASIDLIGEAFKRVSVLILVWLCIGRRRR